MADTFLFEAASGARSNAYAPYSGYSVGAALLDEQGRVHIGCNVENISYGATICAERSAVLRMVAEGGKSVRSIAVATKDGGTPCGMCLQVLAEFTEAPDELEVHVLDEAGKSTSYTLSELLPHGFSSREVNRTKLI
jgi:cytidine deaminase